MFGDIPTSLGNLVSLENLDISKCFNRKVDYPRLFCFLLNLLLKNETY